MIIIPISDAVSKSTSNDPPIFIFYMFMATMLSTEVLMCFKDFRDWIKSGVEDGDGVLNSKDVRELITYYASLIFLRAFILLILLDKFFGLETELDTQIMLFFGAFGSQGMGILGSFLKKDKV